MNLYKKCPCCRKDKTLNEFEKINTKEEVCISCYRLINDVMKGSYLSGNSRRKLLEKQGYEWYLVEGFVERTKKDIMSRRKH